MKKRWSSRTPSPPRIFLQIIRLQVSSIFRISGESFERERYSRAKVDFAGEEAGRSAGIKISSVSNRGARFELARETRTKRQGRTEPATRTEVAESSPGFSLLSPSSSLFQRATSNPLSHLSLFLLCSPATETKTERASFLFWIIRVRSDFSRCPRVMLLNANRQTILFHDVPFVVQPGLTDFVLLRFEVRITGKLGGHFFSRNIRTRCEEFLLFFFFFSIKWKNRTMKYYEQV